MFKHMLVLGTILVSIAQAQPPDALKGGPGQTPYPRPDPGVEALQRKIAQADRMAERMGYVPINIERSSTIRPPRQTDTVAVVLGAGRYMIAGQCDTGCTDIDLEVYDRNTGLRLPQEKPHGYPTVLVHLSEQRNLAVKILIKQCPSRSCRYSVKVYATRSFPSPAPPEIPQDGSAR